MSSVSIGAASAAEQGRGTRTSMNEDSEYQVLLPQLPTGRVVLNTLFLHADMRARPYRVEHFRDMLASLKLLPDVVALGAYQMSHVWAVTFKNGEAVKQMLCAREVKVKERRCMVIDPGNQAVRLKVHWMLHNLPDEDVCEALAPFGTVKDITRERWRVQGLREKGSSTRLVNLVLRKGLTVEDVPHLLRVAGEQVLVVAPGRAPLCLRCRNTGHIRRECRVPRCALCRRYGHDESQCVKTYASVTGPAAKEEMVELLMDEAEVAEVSPGDADQTKVPVTPPEQEPRGPEEGKSPGTSEPGDEVKQSAKNEPNMVDNVDIEPSSTDTTCSDEAYAEEMEVAGVSGSVVKRTRDQTDREDGDLGDPTSEEPPAKSVVTRRPTFRPKPIIPPDRQPAATKLK